MIRHLLSLTRLSMASTLPAESIRLFKHAELRLQG